MKLFHLSENGTINQFIPKESKKMWGYRKYVWAISEEKVHNYLFPRACPRICISNKNLEALANWITIEKVQNKKAIIFVPTAWKTKIQNCVLYQYEFDPTNFTLIDDIAGYYVSQQIERPIHKRKLTNCLYTLNEMKVAVIFKDLETLKVIYKKVIKAYQAFSIIKWDNLASIEE